MENKSVRVKAYDLDGDGKTIDEAVIVDGLPEHSEPRDWLCYTPKGRIEHLVRRGLRSDEQLFQTDLKQSMTPEEQNFLDNLYRLLEKQNQMNEKLRW